MSFLYSAGLFGPDSIVIDDFESQSYSNYQEDTSDWGFNTSDPLEGSASAEPSTTTSCQIYSESGLQIYPGRGDTIRVRFRSDGADRFNNDDGFGFALQGGSAANANGYIIAMSPDNAGTAFAISKDSLDNTLADDDTISIPNGQVVEIEILFDDPTITARLYDGLIDDHPPILSEISADDTAYDSGGISFEQNSGSPDAAPYWDYARVIPDHIVQ